MSRASEGKRERNRATLKDVEIIGMEYLNGQKEKILGIYYLTIIDKMSMMGCKCLPQNR